MLDVVVAGVASGLVLGVLGRLAMALLALAGSGAPRFSLGGTVEVLLTGVLIGVVGAGVFAPIQRASPRHAIAKGLAFGLLVFGLLVLAPLPAAQSALQGAPAHLVRLAGPAFALAFAAYGAVLGALTARVRVSSP